MEMSAESPAEELLDALLLMGFTPTSHPDLVKDMQRAFKEASAHTDGITEDDPIGCKFTFDEDGTVACTIRKL